MNRFQWTDEATTIAVTMSERGVQHKNIAFILGTSRQVVKNKLAKMPRQETETVMAITNNTFIECLSSYPEQPAKKPLPQPPKSRKHSYHPRNQSKPPLKKETKKELPCLGDGCGKMMLTTIETRLCDECRNSPLQSCGYS